MDAAAPLMSSMHRLDCTVRAGNASQDFVRVDISAPEERYESAHFRSPRMMAVMDYAAQILDHAADIPPCYVPNAFFER